MAARAVVHIIDPEMHTVVRDRPPEVVVFTLFGWRVAVWKKVGSTAW